MIVSTIPFTRIDPGNDLARAYLTDPESCLDRFARDYRDPRALKPLLEEQDAPTRVPLAPILTDYNREVGGSVENAARIDDAFCVVSGQQVGLLYGPAYTTYKLFTVINNIDRPLELLDAFVFGFLPSAFIAKAFFIGTND